MKIPHDLPLHWHLCLDESLCASFRWSLQPTLEDRNAWNFRYTFYTYCKSWSCNIKWIGSFILPQHIYKNQGILKIAFPDQICLSICAFSSIKHWMPVFSDRFSGQSERWNCLRIRLNFLYILLITEMQYKMDRLVHIVTALLQKPGNSQNHISMHEMSLDLWLKRC